jgi:hypothetical protein
MEQTLFFQQLHQPAVAVAAIVAVLPQVLMVVQVVAAVLGQAVGLSLVAQVQPIKGELVELVEAMELLLALVVAEVQM